MQDLVYMTTFQMSEFEDMSDAEMEEDWTDTRWAVPDVIGSSEVQNEGKFIPREVQ